MLKYMTKIHNCVDCERYICRIRQSIPEWFDVDELMGGGVRGLPDLKWYWGAWMLKYVTETSSVVLSVHVQDTYGWFDRACWNALMLMNQWISSDSWTVASYLCCGFIQVKQTCMEVSLPTKLIWLKGHFDHDAPDEEIFPELMDLKLSLHCMNIQ